MTTGPALLHRGVFPKFRARFPRLGLAGAGALVAVSMIGATPTRAAAPASDKQPVTIGLQDRVEAGLARQLVKPETARYVFDFVRPKPGGGDIVCGKVDYQDSAKQYRGLHRFFAEVRNGKVGRIAMESDDPLHNRSMDFDFAALCDRR